MPDRDVKFFHGTRTGKKMTHASTHPDTAPIQTDTTSRSIFSLFIFSPILSVDARPRAVARERAAATVGIVFRYFLPAPFALDRKSYVYDRDTAPVDDSVQLVRFHSAEVYPTGGIVQGELGIFTIILQSIGSSVGDLERASIAKLSRKTFHRRAGRFRPATVTITLPLENGMAAYHRSEGKRSAD